MSDSVLDSLKKWFDNPENVRKFQEDMIKEHNRKKRYMNKLHSLSQDDFDNFIQKCIDKYESDDYRYKEYNHGYEPRCPLYDVILWAAEVYGEDIPVDEMFQAEKINYRGWIVELYIGQGSFINIYKG